jgi:hypothetical protein
MNNPELKGSLANQGAYIIASTPQRYGAFIAEQLAAYKKAVDDAGIKLDS